MPLPCSPVSNSTASESHSVRSSSDESDASLTTPRPGPADPAERSVSKLSTPFTASSPSTTTARSRDKQPTWPTSAATTSPTEQNQRDSAGEERRSFGESRESAGSKERTRSITFIPQTASAKPSRSSSYASYSRMATNASPSRGPSNGLRNRMDRDLDAIAAESSADENTAIVKNSSSTKLNYGATRANVNGEIPEQDRLMAEEGQHEGRQQRKTSSSKVKRNNRNASPPALGQAGAQKDSEAEHEGWFRSMIDKYGSVELENKGSVARDHLALERTFLAWLRTSLSFASIGIAVTQLFRLNTTISGQPDSPESEGASARLRHIGKPLGATFLAISILILLLGFHRYFESQHYVIRGKFPASRGTIIIVSAVATASLLLV